MIQKTFNTKDLRKKESKLRGQFNRAITAVTELELGEPGAKIVKQLEDTFVSKVAVLVKENMLAPQPTEEVKSEETTATAEVAQTAETAPAKEFDV